MTKESRKRGRSARSDDAKLGADANDGDGGVDDLSAYRSKRDPTKTSEPFSAERKTSARETRGGVFVVHLHDARRRHYDLRIQVGSALASFAVPKGPSLNPKDKRLAVRTEPHPIEYLDFEDVIPEGQYGAGPMIAWDIGRVRYVEGTAEEGIAGGDLKLELDGHKLRGRWALVETSRRGAALSGAGGGGAQSQWLLLKKQDAGASDVDVTEAEPRSVLSGLTIDELGRRNAVAAAIEAMVARVGAAEADVDARRLVPMLCATADDLPFDRDGLLYELKLDGVRILADKRGEDVALRYRSGRAATATYPEITRAVRALAPERVVLDGEIVAFDDTGRPSFQRLGRRIHASTPFEVKHAALEVPVAFLVFDVLAVGGRDLRDVPLVRRKEVLRKLIQGRGFVRLLDHVEDGRVLYDFCEAQGLEGVVAKRADGPYRPGPVRTDDWIKVKRERDDDFVVVGWVEGKGARGAVGSLEVASWSDDRLVLRGRVGSGLDVATLRHLLPELERLESESSPAEGELQRASTSRHFVEPKLVVAVRYSGWSDDGHLRHPVFAGLRPDRKPRDCVVAPPNEQLEAGVDTASEAEPDAGAPPAGAPTGGVAPRVALTNQDKIFWPDEGYTKGQLCGYYASISDALLPFLEDRPVMLVRHPDGIDGKSFYQWRVPRGTPDWIRTHTIRSEEHDGKNVTTFVIDGADALVHVANLGCIALHVLAARVASLDQCDFLTVDFDLGDNPFRHAVTLALGLKDLLGEMGLSGYPKTSGQTGMHVLVPLGPGVPFEAAKILVELLGRLLLTRHADIATMERRKDRRGGKVLIDVGQTGRSRTIVAPYAVRATSGARVSTPLFWDEVHLALDPARYDMFTVPTRVAELGDPFEGLLGQRPDVATAVATMEKMAKG